MSGDDDGTMKWPRMWLYIIALVGGMAWGIWFIWKVSST
jgi:hypothetical protein